VAIKKQDEYHHIIRKQDILIIREFENPRELVFTAFTDLDLYAAGLGPRVLSMTLELFEPHAVAGGAISIRIRSTIGSFFTASIIMR